MRASNLKAVLTAAFLIVLSDAARKTQIRSKAFLSTGVSADAQQKTHTTTQLSLLQQIQSQLNSDINQVQRTLKVAVGELENWAQQEPAKESRMTNGTAADPKHNAALVREVKGNSSKFGKVGTTHHNATSNDHAAQKMNTTRMHNASKPDINVSSSFVAHDSSRKARVRQVAQAQQTILENLFKHLKSNIVNLNKQEGSSKEVASKNIQRLQARMKADKAELQKKGLSQFEHDRLVNRTRTDTFELQYWTRDRSLGHQMFHTNLKLEHGLMARVHEVIAACKDAASKGHMDPAMLKKLQGETVPKAFVEMRSNLKRQAQKYYAHVLTARWMAAEEPESP
eukprot:gnl/MRDRNA2_/MRDRNA2_92042_c1_seq1.p1 gnl/MRDRNA2_/MRDRNA2_92042_c1~~gnl/MRDRNA2_/MRDRNA2_92042_c1_seq1.p1  ORF type:complete len:340 (+),score=76.80 gnl/MRDRNA2_/MRDRNA2_92042_c1_seq1:94-1113(+)